MYGLVFGGFPNSVYPIFGIIINDEKRNDTNIFNFLIFKVITIGSYFYLSNTLELFLENYIIYSLIGKF